jgi:hypothetical protein
MKDVHDNLDADRLVKLLRSIEGALQNALVANDIDDHSIARETVANILTKTLTYIQSVTDGK